MKPSITYREITIAIGILVALVIALTLWTRMPSERTSGKVSLRDVNIPATARYFLSPTVSLDKY